MASSFPRPRRWHEISAHSEAHAQHRAARRDKDIGAAAAQPAFLKGVVVGVMGTLSLSALAFSAFMAVHSMTDAKGPEAPPAPVAASSLTPKP